MSSASLLVPRPVEQHDGDVLGLAALGLGDPVDVLRDRVADVDDVGRLGAGDQLLHVEDRRGVVHRAARRDREHRDGVGHPLRGQRGAVDRVDGDVALGPVAVADLLAVEQHRGVVLLALADDDRAAHADGADQHPHRVHRDAVGAVLVALAHPATGRHRGGLGHPDQLESQVAVGGGRRHGQGVWDVALGHGSDRTHGGSWQDGPMSAPQQPSRERAGGYQRSSSGLLGAMIATVVLVLAFVGFRALTRDNAATPVPAIDFTISLQAGRADHKLLMFAPPAVPSGWKATSAAYVPGDSPSWHLGLLTAKQEYVGVEESDVLGRRRPGGEGQRGRDPARQRHDRRPGVAGVLRRGRLRPGPHDPAREAGPRDPAGRRHRARRRPSATSRGR